MSKIPQPQIKRKTLKRIFQQAVPYGLLVPAIFLMALGLLYPIAFGLNLSFYQFKLGSAWQNRTFVGFNNLIDMFKSDEIYTIIRATVLFTFAVTVGTLVVGLILALLLEGRLRGVKVFRALFILPFMLSPVVVALIWSFLYDPMFGLVNYFLGFFGIPPQSWLASPSLAMPSIIIANVWQWTPFMLILLLAGLQSLPQDSIEAAKIDGASYRQILVYVKLPLLKPIITVAVILGWIEAFKVVTLVFNMTYGGPGKITTVLSLQIFKTAFLTQRLGMASTYANLLLIVEMALTAGFLLVLKPGKSIRR